MSFPPCEPFRCPHPRRCAPCSRSTTGCPFTLLFFVDACPQLVANQAHRQLLLHFFIIPLSRHFGCTFFVRDCPKIFIFCNKNEVSIVELIAGASCIIIGNTAQFVGSVGDAFSAICFLQKSRFTSSKPSISAITSYKKCIRYRTNSFVRDCPNTISRFTCAICLRLFPSGVRSFHLA